MNARNAKLTLVGLFLGALLMGMVPVKPVVKAHASAEPTVIGHRIDQFGNSQLVYAK